MDSLQQQVAQFVQENDLETTPEARLLDLFSELGELSKEVLKATNYGQGAFVPTEEWLSEMGDALFSLICLANTTGVDLTQALQDVLQKYQQRLAAKGDAGSGR